MFIAGVRFEKKLNCFLLFFGAVVLHLSGKKYKESAINRHVALPFHISKASRRLDTTFSEIDVTTTVRR
jgi:hypothetical protein